ncbi:TPA: glycosyltransferase family 4 protein [Bacillus anthracis]|uniref:Glycosyl transferase, group 1 family protein n=9 Tax=Bacillus anthracis TaxID=1392 RepID=A0A6L7H841_BACAN|nr:MULTISPECIES: glycosyltransferase family 4 protein [Bacillus]EJT19597.1 glycoside hydrolase family protein [Bacillus anthracis str. UR-1]EXJ17804.1 glycosyl transferase [Bacillus anthracis str. 95014]AAP29164.1 glycosyltransferase, group 1 family [Bacillus anthracis str. Ames]AAT34661.1 glycosyl transferase, group 1 family protein [Bacillus anthracis str. 'Ames Ancestor']AAT57416.1 glycosyl transferase, group 1 family protein [Bacillus anthracis str. Sterne]
MKKILMVTQNFYPEIGSASNRMKNIYLELNERGYDVKILTSDPSYPNRNLYKDSSYWYDENIEKDIVRIHPKTRKYTRNLFRRLILYIEVAFRLILAICKDKEKYDYIFVSTPSIFIPVAGMFAKRKMKAKLIVDVRDLWPESLIGIGFFNKNWILKFAYKLEYKIYHAADNIIINSKGFYSYISSTGIAPNRISFMPNSLTEKELSTVPKKNISDQLTVIYTGNIGLAQDIEKLILIAEHLKEYKNISFKIIGYGYQKKELGESIEAKQLPNMQLIEPKNREDTLAEIVDADIAYVSLVEKDVFKKVLPRKVMDYMSMRKPIVADVAGYAKEVIEDAQCGFVTEDRTVAELSDYIIKLAQDKQLRNRLGENGYQYAFRTLRWKTNIETLLKILEERDVTEESVHVCMESLHK